MLSNRILLPQLYNSTTRNESLPFTVETDASDFAIAASMNEDGLPVAFHSRTLSPSEQRHSAVENEAYAVVEALRKWRDLLIGKHFTLVTDQKSVIHLRRATRQQNQTTKSRGGDWS